MPRNFHKLQNFSGGVNDVKNPRDIGDNELSKAENIMVDERGAIRTIGGEISQSIVGNATAGAVGGYGLAVLESDYETEPLSFTGNGALDIAQSGSVTSLQNGQPIDGITEVGGGAEVSFAGVHGYADEDSIIISGAGDYDGTYTITYVDTLTFSINVQEGNQGSGGSAFFNWDNIANAGDEISITGSVTSDGFYTIVRSSAGTILYVTPQVSGADSNNSATVLVLPKEDVLVVLSDATTAKVDTYSKNQDTWTADQITLDTTSGNLPNRAKTSYYVIDGAIRACDGEFGNASKIQWFGQIKRNHFTGANATAQSDYFNWYAKDNDLAAPTDGEIGDTYPGANTGFDLEILTPANPDSTWQAATYQIASSFIYDGSQESLLYVPSANNTFAVADGDSVTVSVHANTDATGYNPRISGGRAYARIDGSDDAWFLLCDIDMRKGARATLDGTYAAWVDGTSLDTNVDSGLVTSLSQNLDTYESLNGFSNEETSIALGQSGEGWRVGTVANRRAFVANVRRLDPNTGQNKTYGDRITYSEIGKFDTFPESNYMDVVRGDAENYVKVIEYADRLLAFKQNSVQIINISSPSPSGWFLEDNFKYQGVYHSGAVTKTDYGIAWVNESGCYLYDGQKINNLTRDNLDSSTWSTFIGTASNHISIIGFERFKKQLIVMKDCTTTQSDGGDAWLYDFFTRSWVKGLDVFTDSKAYTNFVHDWNGDLVTAYDNSGIMTFVKWSDTSIGVAANGIKIQTKDIDFNEPGRIKKVYGARISYKSTAAQTAPISLLGNNLTTGTQSLTGNFTNSSPAWDILNATLSTATEVQSVAVYVTNPTNTGKIEINDISLDYRTIHRKVT